MNVYLTEEQLRAILEILGAPRSEAPRSPWDGPRGRMTQSEVRDQTARDDVLRGARRALVTALVRS